MKHTSNDNSPELGKIIVSTVANCKRTKTSDASFMDVLQDIQAGRWRKDVETVRAAQQQHGKTAADPLKKKLPAVLFSGRFSRRDSNHLLEHSGLLCADLDELNGELEQVRQNVESDPHTLACFLSPRGNGLKIIYRIEPNPEGHEAAFYAIAAHLQSVHHVEADPKCKEIVRLCFVSYDPALFLNPQARIFRCDIDHTDHIDHLDHKDHLSNEGETPAGKTPDPTPEKTIWSISHPEKVQEIIMRTQPKQPGERHRCVFNLARGLKYDAGLHDAPLPELKKFVRQWFKLAEPHIATKDFSESWSDFIHAWSQAHTPLADGPITKAWHLVETEPLPKVCADYDGEKVKKLLALCIHLKRPDGTFYLSMPKAGELLRVHPYQVRRYLRMFQVEELLKIVKPGNRQTATTYRWMR